MNKKWISLLLALVMAGCSLSSSNQTTDNLSPSQNQQTIQDSINEKDQNSKPEKYTIVGDEEFEAYTQKNFVENCEESYTYAHRYFKDPEKHGIKVTDKEITLGTIVPSQEDIDETKDFLKGLKSVDPNSLSEENRVILEELKWETDLALRKNTDQFKYINQLWKTSGGLPDNTVEFFSQYNLYDESGIEPLIQLIEDVPNYVSQALKYSNEQAARGMLMMDYDAVMNYCQSVVDSKENSPIFSELDDEVDALLLGKTKSAQYKEKIHDALNKCFFPSYQKIMDGLEKLKDDVIPLQGMSELENGEEYYTLTLETYIGKKVDPQKLYDEITKIMQELSSEYNTLLKNNPDAVVESTMLRTPFKSTDEIMNFLEDNYTRDFPYVPSLKYELQPLSDQLSNQSVMAFFLIPTIDSKDPGQIRYNKRDYADDPSDLQFFVTLAHEGIPGHLYQYRYFSDHFNQNIQYTLGTLGPLEGYAVYASYKALGWLGYDEDTLKAYLLHRQYRDMMYLMMDLEINYMGMSRESFKKTYGDQLDPVYDQLCEMSGQFFSYYYAPLLYQHMEEHARDVLQDDFDPIDFNAALLKWGNVNFDLIEQTVDKYIDDTIGSTLKKNKTTND